MTESTVTQILRMGLPARKRLKSMAAQKGLTMSEYIEQIINKEWTNFVEEIKVDVKEI
jgi:predicted DNA-binding protein|tara:strand:+ start:282 stop:455 length:174 start_codon:yes stop_codon:yes gene_type:complete